VGAALYLADRREHRRTYMKLMAAFLNFANVPEKVEQNKGQGCGKINEIMEKKKKISKHVSYKSDSRCMFH
jgi:hypothetical protein